MADPDPRAAVTFSRQPAGRIGGSAQLRHRHLAEVLWYLREHGPSSRIDVASNCQLGISTMTDLVQELKRRLLVKELPAVRGPRRGRPTQPIALEDDSPWCVLGLQLSPGGVTSEVVTLGGQVVGRRQHDPSPIPADADELLTHLGDILRRHLTGLPGGKAVIGAGAALPGIVAGDGNDLRGADGLPWNGMPVRAWLTAALERAGLSRLSVTVASEAQFEALHAARMLARVPAKHTALYVGGRRSISGAVIADRRIHQGHHGTAGSLAHLPVGRSDTVCACGGRECLDAVASLPALLTRTGATPQADSGTPVADEHRQVAWLRGEAEAGAPAAVAALDTAGAALRIALHAACTVLDPTVVIIGGHLGGFRDHLRPIIDAGLDQTVAYLDADTVDAVQGAILAAQDACLAEPLVWTEPCAAESVTPGRSITLSTLN